MVLLLLLAGMDMTKDRKRDIEITAPLAMIMTAMGGNRLHGIVAVHLLQNTGGLHHQTIEVLVKEAHIQMTDLLMKGGGGQMTGVLRQGLEMIDLHHGILMIEIYHLDEIEDQRDTLMIEDTQMTGIRHPDAWMTEGQQGH